MTEAIQHGTENNCGIERFIYVGVDWMIECFVEELRFISWIDEKEWIAVYPINEIYYCNYFCA